MTGDWVLFAPMRLEAWALRRALPAGAPVRRTGTGLARAARAASRHGDAKVLAVAGIAGALSPQLGPGDLVVATEVRLAGEHPGAVLPCRGASTLAAALRRRGLTVCLGPVVSSRRWVDGAARTRLAATGALAVDTESAALLAEAADRPVACVRAIADGPAAPLYRPGTLLRVARALRALTRAGPALAEWAGTVSLRTAVEQATTSVEDVHFTLPKEKRPR
ncbi:phosphorylase family protein [Micromonospora sp. NPDC003197]